MISLENDLLKVGIGEKGEFIQVLDKRNEEMWTGHPDTPAIAAVSYWKDKEKDSKRMLVGEEMGWKSNLSLTEGKIDITFNNLDLGLLFHFVVRVVNDVVKITIPLTKIQEKKVKQVKIKEIEPMLRFGIAQHGEDGYIVLPDDSGIMCHFNKKGSIEHWQEIYGEWRYNMPIFGLKRKMSAFVGIITQGEFNAWLGLGVRQGKSKNLYYIYPKFTFRYYPDEKRAEDDLSIEYHFLSGESASYVGMAKRYRSHILNSGKVKPLRERIKTNSSIDYLLKAVPIRFMCAQKEYPPPVLKQTPENEPPLNISVTFSETEEVLKECKKEGVEKLNFQLVGWQKSGHDGCYPQKFPVEPALGGEKGLRKLIKTAQGLGYQIVGDDNYWDAYQLAEDWDEKFLLKQHDGSLRKWGKCGGGQAYLICPKRAYEFAKRDLPRIRKLGFQGVYFVDCISSSTPISCYDPTHPLSKKESAQYMLKTLQLAEEIFGGVQSEGPQDYCNGVQARIHMIPAYYSEEEKKKRWNVKSNLPLDQWYMDTEIPFYQIVYHGIVSYALRTVPGWRGHLRDVEYGAQPHTRFDLRSAYSLWSGYLLGVGAPLHFTDNKNYNQNEVKQMAKKIYKMYDEFIVKLGYLQTEFIENHQSLAPDIFKTTYSDGSQIVVNYSDKAYEYGEYRVQAHSYLLIK